MQEPNGEHDHRNLDVIEEPLDVANESLSDALRSSFGILKGILLVLVLLFLLSNVRRIESHEQAIHLRLGALLPTVHEPGLVWAFPFPIDEIVALPTKKSNELIIDSHTFGRSPNEVGKPLAFISRGFRGLDPAVDGALLTADAGLVHVRWKITYKINDVARYVTEMLGDKLEAAEALLKTYVETVGVAVATELSAEEIVRTRMEHMQSEVRRRLNQRLTDIHSGITVARVEMFEPTPPIQIRDAFDQTQRSQNSKQRMIRKAEQERTEILNKAAGAAYPELIRLLDGIDQARATGSSLDKLREELDAKLSNEVEGEAGRMIKDAGAYRTIVVGRIEGDVDLYRKLLPEFERTPELLVARLWEQTKQEIFKNSDVTKFYRPPGSEIRIEIPLDPEQTRIEEARRLESQEFDMSKLRPKRAIPIGPE